MFIDSTAAKALAMIILTSTQGADAVQPQLPLHVVDRGESWLVTGTPYADAKRGVQYCFAHVIIRKKSAEVVSIGSDIRMILTDKEKKQWHEIMTEAEYNRIFGPRTRFDEGGPELTKNLFLNKILYGGLINRPDDATAYAKVLLGAKPQFAALPISAFHAEERSSVWHITLSAPNAKQTPDLVSFSRLDGKVISEGQ